MNSPHLTVELPTQLVHILYSIVHGVPDILNLLPSGQSVHQFLPVPSIPNIAVVLELTGRCDLVHTFYEVPY